MNTTIITVQNTGRRPSALGRINDDLRSVGAELLNWTKAYDSWADAKVYRVRTGPYDSIRYFTTQAEIKSWIAARREARRLNKLEQAQGTGIIYAPVFDGTAYVAEAV